MFDPRDDTRDRGEDGSERAYEGPEQSGDPRDVFLRDVDLPLDREREYVFDRDQVYELDGDDSRTLATVGAFRIVPERDLLDGDEGLSDSLDHPRRNLRSIVGVKRHHPPLAPSAAERVTGRCSWSTTPPTQPPARSW